MGSPKLSTYDYENIHDCVLAIEADYQLRFSEEELQNVPSIGAFIDLALGKITLENVESCTTQQAFYKIRAAIAKLETIDSRSITPSTEIQLLFPRKQRVFKILQLEKELGFKLYITEPHPLAMRILGIAFILSVIVSFIDFKTGFCGLFVSAFTMWCFSRFSKHLNVETMRSFIERVTCENYPMLRRRQGTVNKRELREIFLDKFVFYTDLKRARLLEVRFN